MVIDDVVHGISRKLNAAFGQGYRIYENDVKQGLKEPCFFIASLSPSRIQLVGRRYRQIMPFDIAYFPKDGGDNSGMNSIGDQLLDVLEYVTLPPNAPVRGVKMRYEIVDGVLHFFITYELHLMKPAVETPMGALNLTTGTTKG